VNGATILLIFAAGAIVGAVATEFADMMDRKSERRHDD
jgi:predicted outer membrane lipoprotein